MTHDCHHHAASTLRGNIVGFGLILALALFETSLEIGVGYIQGENLPHLGGAFHTINDMFLEIAVFATFIFIAMWPTVEKSGKIIELSFMIIGIFFLVVGAVVVISMAWHGEFRQGHAGIAVAVGCMSTVLNIFKHHALDKYVHKDGIHEMFSLHILGDAALGAVVCIAGVIRLIYGTDGTASMWFYTIEVYKTPLTTNLIDFVLANGVAVYLLLLAVYLARKTHKRWLRKPHHHCSHDHHH